LIALRPERRERIMDARAVAERYYGALRENDLDGVIATLDPACQAEVPGGTLDGREGVRGWMGSFFNAFPSIEHSTGELDVQGQRVAADVHVTGEHTQPFVTPQGTIPPTGRTVDFRARNEMEIRGDSISALRISFDADDFMRQLGIG
jgi:predicted ester cyclase